MPFPCPACGATIDRSVVRWLQRCAVCGTWIRGRAVETGGAHPRFEIEAAGRPETRRLVDVPWDAAARRRLGRWLLVASIVTVSLVLVLFALARWL